MGEIFDIYEDIFDIYGDILDIYGDISRHIEFT
jgi:hypothetical protein